MRLILSSMGVIITTEAVVSSSKARSKAHSSISSFFLLKVQLGLLVVCC